VASLQDDSVGVATALSPVGAGHFKFYHTTFIVGLGLRVQKTLFLKHRANVVRSPNEKALKDQRHC
jgi:hypothetical protein